MSYEIVYGEKVLDRIFRAAPPPEIVDCLETSMARLAADPVGVSRRPPIPFIQHGQMFTFHCDGIDGRRWYFRAHFYYADNEADLRVFAMIAWHAGM